MRAKTWLLALAAAGVTSRIVVRQARARTASRTAPVNPATAAVPSTSPVVQQNAEHLNPGEHLPAQGLGAVPWPTASSSSDGERGSIPGLTDFTRGA